MLLAFVIASALLSSRLIHITSLTISFVAWFSCGVDLNHKNSFCSRCVLDRNIEDCFDISDYLNFKHLLKDLSNFMSYGNGSIACVSHFKGFHNYH